MKNTHDVIIIGAGLSGIAAGIRLAYYGKKVLICEQHTIPGGLNSYYKRGAYTLDVGLHAMTNFSTAANRNAPLNKLLRQLRFKWEDFNLVEQNRSTIKFPKVSLSFSNDFEQLEYQKIISEELFKSRPILTKIDIPEAVSLDKFYTLCASVLQNRLNVPVRMVSFGPTELDKICR